MNIFVGSLPFKLEEADLREIFEQYGEVSSTKIIIDRATGRSKGYGFIEMAEEEAAKKAIEELNGAEVEGREIVVNVAQERSNNNFNKPRRFNNGGSRGGNGGGYRSGGRDRGGYSSNNY